MNQGASPMSIMIKVIKNEFQIEKELRDCSNAQYKVNKDYSEL